MEDKTVEQIVFERSCAEATELFLRKNAQYGNAFGRGGLLAAIFDINGIAARLQTMMYNFVIAGEPLDEHKMRDVLTDLHNYANIAKITLAQHNFIGWEHNERIPRPKGE